MPTANPKPRCKVSEIKPTFLGKEFFVVHLSTAKLLMGRIYTFLWTCYTRLRNTNMTQNNSDKKPKYFGCGIMKYFLSVTARSMMNSY